MSPDPVTGTAQARGVAGVPHSYSIADGHRLRHNPLKAIIGPRPIGWLSTISADGIPNLAPYSFFTMVNDTPPLLMFSSTGFKDTVSNIDATGEFVVNLATRPLAEAVNMSSGAFDAATNEFECAGLGMAASMLVRPPRVAETPAALECRAVEIRRLHDLEGRALDAWMTIGQIVAVHLATDCIVDDVFLTERARPILRAGYGADYWAIGAQGKFEMWRPHVPVDGSA